MYMQEKDLKLDIEYEPERPDSNDEPVTEEEVKNSDTWYAEI